MADVHTADRRHRRQRQRLGETEDGSYGVDWLMRMVANFTGIWPNTQNEVIYFANGNASPLNGRDFYTATFTKNDLPDAHVQYFWSVICVDAVNFAPEKLDERTTGCRHRQGSGTC